MHSATIDIRKSESIEYSHSECRIVFGIEWLQRIQLSNKIVLVAK